MFSLSARFRKSRTPGVEGTVYYVIKQGKSERNITGNIHGIDQSVMSEAKERIAFDLMTIYCVIESIFQSDNKIELDDIVEACASAILKTNPFEERIKNYRGKYPVSYDIAKVPKLFYDKFEPKRSISINHIDKSGLIGYLSYLIDEYNAEGKHFVQSLRNTQLSLLKYLKNTEKPLSSISHSFISGYNTYLSKRVSPSTVSFYLRVLRTVLKRAEQENLLPMSFHWPSEIKTTILRNSPTTEIYALDVKTIHRIDRMNLSCDKSLELARDVFMFGFYAQGMEFIDVANLRTDNLKDNVLTYRRRLKGKVRNVVLGNRALAIISKYHDDSNDYIFPILQRKRSYAYSTVKVEIAASLKKIGQMLNLLHSLTFSMNIYSWQSIIRKTNITELFIS